MRLVVTGAFLGVVLAGQPGSAQECVLYADAGCGATIGDHVTVDGGLGGGDEHEEVCMRCLMNGSLEPVTPDHCHKCPGGEGGEYFEEGDISGIVAAIEAGDLWQLLRDAPELSDLVHVNRQRSAIQVHSSCDREFIVAHIPVTKVDLDEVEMVALAARARTAMFGQPSRLQL